MQESPSRLICRLTYTEACRDCTSAPPEELESMVSSDKGTTGHHECAIVSITVTVGCISIRLVVFDAAAADVAAAVAGAVGAGVATAAAAVVVAVVTWYGSSSNPWWYGVVRCGGF